MMFLSRMFMQFIPNVHLLGTFIAATTLVYRLRALLPLYGYILLDGAFHGFSSWWVPYLYIWLPVWLMFMAVGKLQFPAKFRAPLYMVLVGLHGLSFGVLYAPFQAWVFGLGWNGMIAWIVAGFPFDVIHGVGNFAAGTLIIPLSALIGRLTNGQAHY